MTRQEALAIYRRNGLLLAQINGLREDVAERLAILETERDEARDALLAAHAAGYARAERDVVAFITSAIDHDAERMRATAQRGNAMQSNAYAAGHTALSLTRKRIEDHCHRGAAKDEAPRGEGDGR